MKKTLPLLFCALISVCGFGQTFTLKEGVSFSGISPNGKWAFSVVVENEWTQTPGAVIIYDVDNDKVEYLEGTIGNAPYADGVSNEGLFVGSIGNKAAFLSNKTWTLLPLPDDNRIIESHARGVSEDGSVICGLVDIGLINGARMPIVWTKQQNGEYTFELLPAPEKDFTSRRPQAADALRVSADGSIIVGRLIDYSGMYSIILVWEKQDGKWKYKTAGEDIVIVPGVDIPYFDEESAPTQPDPTEYFTESDWETYNAAVAKYLEDIENDPENYWSYQNPEYYQADYITENKEAYDAAYAVFVIAAEEYNDELMKFFEALDAATTGNAIEVTFINLSRSGKYLATTINAADPNSDPEAWFPTRINAPAFINLETGEYSMYTGATDALAYYVTDNGDLYYATPYMAYTRYSYVLPAGANSAVEISEWVATKSNNKIDLTKELLFEWTEYTWDYELEEDVPVLKNDVITGAVMPSANGDVLISSFMIPDGSNIFSYVVDFTKATDINDVNTANRMGVYPNPTTDVLYFSEKADNVTVSDLSGRIVYNGKPANNNIDVTGFGQGVYLVKVTSNHTVSTHKVIVK